MIYQHSDFDQHEQVIFCHDPDIGLRGIIAIHSTALGPAAGGCRMHPYASLAISQSRNLAASAEL